MRMSGIKKPSRSRGPADRYHNGAPIYLATIRGCRDTSAPCSSYLLRRSEMVPSPALSESWTHQWHSDGHGPGGQPQRRSEEHTSELQSLMRISYAVFCLKKKKNTRQRPKQYDISKYTRPERDTMIR